MAAVTKMPKDVEQRIRSLPGNNVCVDCSNLNPQWASVTYGCLMCLECSGQHRSIGVHLSFVRSIAMDSWKPREIEAMEKSGGNQCLIDFFESKGIAKEMAIATKYGTKQADYYKNRLTRWLDGRREPPPDPGRYDPATGGSDAQGAEALPGETTAQYNERQARLREAARERMRAKFGNNGMSGMGSGGQMGGVGSPQQDDDNFWGAIGGKLGGAVSGIGSFVKEKVIENDELKAKVGGITRRATDSDLFGAIQRNVTAQEGSVVRKSMGWATGTAGAVASGLFESGSCENGHSMRIENQPEIRCDDCKAIGTRYVCSRGCGFVQCQKCFEKPKCIPAGGGGGAASRVSGGSSKKSGNWDDDDDWGVSAPEPEKDLATIQKELGMSLSVSGTPAAPGSGGGTPLAARGATAPSPVASKPPMAQTSAAAEPKPKSKPKAGLASEEDFFAEFGM